MSKEGEEKKEIEFGGTCKKKKSAPSKLGSRSHGREVKVQKKKERHMYTQNTKMYKKVKKKAYNAIKVR